MNKQPSVSAADLVRHFAEYRELARDSAIYVTHHGRPTTVLINAEAYETLLSTTHGERTAGSLNRQSEMLFSLTDWIDAALIICDRDTHVQYINRAAKAMFNVSNESCTGADLFEIVPQLSGSILEGHVYRTIDSREPSTMEVPSPFAQKTWLHFKSFPLQDYIFLEFRDITSDVERYRMADIKGAIIQCMSTHGEIGYVRVSIRGTIDRVNEPFCEMVALPEERLMSVTLSDLVDISGRAAFKECLEGVFRGDDPATLTTQLLSNSGKLVSVKTAVVPLRGAYGTEGAVIVMTPESSDDHGKK